RALADAVVLGHATVAAACRELRVRGLVRGGGRRGTLVNRRPPIVTPSLPSAPPGTVNLADGNPDPELLPSLAPVLARLRGGHQLYGGETNRPRLIELAMRGFRRDRINTESVAGVSGGVDRTGRGLAP